MQLTPAQSVIVSDTTRFRVVNCGRRFGKSTLSAWEMVGKAISRDDMQIAYIANTYQQARDIVWEMLKEIARPVTVKVNESRLELIIKTQQGGTSTITLRGWENADTLRGLKFHLLVVDEVASMRNFWTIWRKVLRPTLTDYVGEALFLSTPRGFNHFYDLFNIQDDDKDFKSYHFSSYDNPHLPKEELDKAKQELTDDEFSQEYMADFRKLEGLVYKEFDRERHSFNKEDLTDMDFSLILAGVDFGYTNPAGVLRIAKDRDSRYWVTDEWYETKQTTETIADTVQGYMPSRVYPDPAEPDRIEILKKKGLNCLSVSKDIVAGIGMVRQMFKQNRLFVSKSCKNLLWELETYHYPDKKPDRNEEEKPVKENDHLMDSLRYAIYMEELKPVTRRSGSYTPDYKKSNYV